MKEGREIGEKSSAFLKLVKNENLETFRETWKLGKN